MTDEYLIELMSSGDREGFYGIIEKYNKLLWVITGGILSGIGTHEDIEECVSDVYISLWRNPKAFDPDKGSLKTFLSVVAKRKAIDRYRKLVKTNIVDLDDYSGVADDDLIDHVIKNDLQQVLYNAIRSFKEPDKEIFIRRYFFDEMPSVITVKTSIAVKEIKNRLYQSKLKLMEQLKIKGVI